jgi:hypothetical protein
MRIATSPPRLHDISGGDSATRPNAHITYQETTLSIRGVTPFPALELQLSLWTAKLGELILRMKTIKRYLTSLKSLHIDLELSTGPFGNHRLQRIIRGLNRLHGDQNKKERLPITRGLLIRILSLLEANDPHDSNLYEAFCMVNTRFL